MQGDPRKDRTETAEDDPKAMAADDREHRFADDEQVEDGAAGAPEARTDGMGS